LVVVVFGGWCLEVEQVALLSKGVFLLLCCCGYWLLNSGLGEEKNEGWEEKEVAS